MSSPSLKRRILTLAGQSGLFHLAASSAWRRQRLMILCYHGISLVDEHLWNPGLYMDRYTFRDRLAMLRDGGYRVLPLDEGLRHLAKGTLPPRAVAITVDDGTYDFYAHALPALREFGLPATLYLTTYYCRHQLPVFDPVCSYMLWKSQGQTFDATGIL